MLVRRNGDSSMEQEGKRMIWYQKIKLFVPKYANYDYTRVYDRNDRCIGWIRIYYEYVRANDETD